MIGIPHDDLLKSVQSIVQDHILDILSSNSLYNRRIRKIHQLNTRMPLPRKLLIAFRECLRRSPKVDEGKLPVAVTAEHAVADVPVAEVLVAGETLQVELDNRRTAVKVASEPSPTTKVTPS